MGQVLPVRPADRKAVAAPELPPESLPTTGQDVVLDVELGPRTDWRVPILQTEAARGVGVAEVAERIAEHREHIREQGTLEERRRRNLMNEVMALATYRLRRKLEESVREDESVQSLLDEVVARRLDPASAAAKLLDREL